jgi:hypothetical protein
MPSQKQVQEKMANEEEAEANFYGNQAVELWREAS